MYFNSFTFLIFLAIVLPVYYALSHRWQNRLLLAASYVFYGTWDWRFLFLLVGSTVVDFFVAGRLERTSDVRVRRWLLGISLTVNLGFLFVFKYFNFFVDSFCMMTSHLGLGELLWAMRVVVPVGISFYTFQTLAYTIDVYWRKVQPTRNFVDFALYVSYFPQLVAGPIERAGRLLPQICQKRVVRPEQLAAAMQLILMGYVKKIAIADAVAPYVNDIFAEPAACSTLKLLVGLYLFAVQIYGDFSGYSDIARGVSRLFGIELMVNFRQPYLSASITEFWRRWHISLSSWLREYLYIPLGGNRSGQLKTYRNLMIVMLLGGLWHGASWTFVIWGGLHGLYLAIERFMHGHSSKRAEAERDLTPGQWAGFVLRVLFTFHLVCLAWLFFRADSFGNAFTYLSGLLHGGLACERALLAVALFYVGLMLLIDLPCWVDDREVPFVQGTRWYIRGIAQAAALILITFVGASGASEFIYFQF